MGIRTGGRESGPRLGSRVLPVWLFLVIALMVAVPTATIAQDITPFPSPETSELSPEVSPEASPEGSPEAATPAASPEASPDASPVASSEDGEAAARAPRQDLAAMALTPDQIGAGYGIASAQYSDLNGLAPQFAGALAVGEDEARQRLEAAGFVQLYNVTYGLAATAEGQLTASRVVQLFVYQYATDGGGRAGFTMLGDAWSMPGYEAVEGTKKYGNESRLASVSLSEGADQRLLMSFRVHELVVGIVIQDTTGTAPTVEEIEALASALRRQMRPVENGEGPDLANRTLQTTSSSGAFAVITTEYYDRRGGTTVRRFIDTDETVALRDQVWAAASDVYVVNQTVQRQNAGDNPPYANVAITTLRFADAGSAAAFVTDGAQVYLNAAGIGEAQVIGDAPVFGDSSLAVTFQVSDAQGATTTGFVYFVQIGDRVAIVQAAAPASVDRAAVEKLVQRQVDCFTGESCRAAQVPKGLVAR